MASRRVCPSRSPQYGRVGAIQRHAAPGHQTDFSPLNLANPAFAAHLTHTLDDMQPALHIRFGQIAARSINRQFAPKLYAPPLDKGPRFTRLAEAAVLEPQQ